MSRFAKAVTRISAKLSQYFNLTTAVCSRCYIPFCYGKDLELHRRRSGEVLLCGKVDLPWQNIKQMDQFSKSRLYKRSLEHKVFCENCLNLVGTSSKVGPVSFDSGAPPREALHMLSPSGVAFAITSRLTGISHVIKTESWSSLPLSVIWKAGLNEASLVAPILDDKEDEREKEEEAAESSSSDVGPKLVKTGNNLYKWDFSALSNSMARLSSQTKRKGEIGKESLDDEGIEDSTSEKEIDLKAESQGKENQELVSSVYNPTLAQSEILSRLIQFVGSHYFRKTMSVTGDIAYSLYTRLGERLGPLRPSAAYGTLVMLRYVKNERILRSSLIFDWLKTNRHLDYVWKAAPELLIRYGVLRWPDIIEVDPVVQIMQVLNVLHRECQGYQDSDDAIKWTQKIVFRHCVETGVGEKALMLATKYSELGISFSSGGFNALVRATLMTRNLETIMALLGIQAYDVMGKNVTLPFHLLREAHAMWSVNQAKYVQLYVDSIISTMVAMRQSQRAYLFLDLLVCAGFLPAHSPMIGNATLLRLYASESKFEQFWSLFTEMIENKRIDTLPRNLLGLLGQSLAKVKEVDRVFSFFDYCVEKGLCKRTDNAVVSSLLSACATPEAFPRAVALYQEYTDAGCPPDLILHNTMLNVCTQALFPDEAERYFEVGRAQGLINEVSVSTLLTAFLRTRKPDRIAHYIDLAEKEGLPCGEVSYTIAIQCYYECSMLTEALKLYQRGREKGFWNAQHLFREQYVLDLHGANIATAKIFLLGMLQSLYYSLKGENKPHNRNFTPNSKTGSPYHSSRKHNNDSFFLIITGKGNNNDLGRSILKPAIENMLRHELHPPLLEYRDAYRNPGAIIIDTEALSTWVKALMTSGSSTLQLFENVPIVSLPPKPKSALAKRQGRKYIPPSPKET